MSITSSQVNVISGLFEIFKKHRGPHKRLSWATCCPRAECLRPWYRR